MANSASSLPELNGLDSKVVEKIRHHSEERFDYAYRLLTQAISGYLISFDFNNPYIILSALHKLLWSASHFTQAWLVYTGRHIITGYEVNLQAKNYQNTATASALASVDLLAEDLASADLLSDTATVDTADLDPDRLAKAAFELSETELRAVCREYRDQAISGHVAQGGSPPGRATRVPAPNYLLVKLLRTAGACRSLGIACGAIQSSHDPIPWSELEIPYSD